MAALAIRKTTFQGLSVRDRTILRWLGDFLALGSPAEYESSSAARWFIFDDWRFEPKVIAYLGCVLANLSEIPSGYTLPLLDDEDGNPTTVVDRPQLRSDIRTFCESGARGNLLVLPKDITFTEGGNFWQEILDAQNTPAAVQMASGVPDDWTAVNDSG